MAQQVLKVTDMAPSGAGVAFDGGLRIFVPGALPGDRVRADVTPPARGAHSGIAQPIEWLEESAWREQKPCAAYKATPACGGCPLAALSPIGQAAIKTRLLTDALASAKVDAPTPLPLIEAATLEGTFTTGFRNKAVLYASMSDTHTWQFALYSQGSHTPVPASVHCPQTPRWMADVALATAKALDDTPLTPWNETLLTGDIRSLLMREGASEHSLQRLVCLVVRDWTPEVLEFARVWAEALKAHHITSLYLCRHPAAGNAVLGHDYRLIDGVDAITTTIGGLTFDVRPETFLQVNPEQTEKLYAQALAWADIKSDDIFLDLYCGIGTMTLMGAQCAKEAMGIEWVEASIERARHNAQKNGLTNTNFYAGAVEDVLPKLIAQGLNPTTAILDPAFKGLDETVPTMLTGLALKRFVYVSCNPKTFARDAARFVKLGWRIEQIVPVDLFPGALHVETVAKFVRD